MFKGVKKQGSVWGEILNIEPLKKFCSKHGLASLEALHSAVENNKRKTTLKIIN